MICGVSCVSCAIQVKPISVKLGMGIPDHDSEGRLITVEFDTFFLLTSYVPNSGEKLVRLVSGGGHISVVSLCTVKDGCHVCHPRFLLICLESQGNGASCFPRLESSLHRTEPFIQFLGVVSFRVRVPRNFPWF